ncbi:MAG: hypothetical protein N3A65_00850 [candidate division WOR-3 bacterium]|nr:hypothetical protein [candidate division WOR-3 bacterium]
MNQFLDAGKGLYIEGCDFVAHNDTTQLVRKFGCLLGGGGLPKDSSNVDILIGQQSSIVDSLSFGYLHRQGPDNLVDYLIPQAATVLFKDQDSLVRVVCWSGNSGNYRAICSSVIFGALVDSLYSKNELMLRYLDYLYKRDN